MRSAGRVIDVDGVTSGEEKALYLYLTRARMCESYTYDEGLTKLDEQVERNVRVVVSSCESGTQRVHNTFVMGA